MIHPLYDLPEEDDHGDLSIARAYLREVAEECAKEVEKSFALPLVSVLQLTDSCFCSSLEEEDKRYGLLVPHLADFAEHRMRVLVENPRILVDEGGYPFMDLAWDGWEAAYIVSKQSASGCLTSPDVLGKRKLWECVPNKEGKEICHDSPAFSRALCSAQSSPFPVNEPWRNISFTQRTASTVQIVIISFLSVLECIQQISLLLYSLQRKERNYKWGLLEKIPGKKVDAIKNHIFEFHVKLILLLFNEIELQRMSHHDQLYAECKDFFIDLKRLGPIPADEKRRRKPDAFSYLIESDMYKAATIMYFGGSQKHIIGQTVPGCGIEVERLKSKAFELIQQHKPLKGHLKAQLVLELTRRKCYHVADTLVLEAINELKLPELFRECIAGDVGYDKVLGELLQSLADSVLESANNLCNMKSMILANAEKDLLRGLLCKLGPCKAEVTHVIKLANYERALQNEHYITPAHILVGLRLSRVSECVQEERIHSHIDSFSGSSSAFYTFRIYQLACSLAKDLGDGEMGLEHFVFAMVYGCLTENLMEFAIQPPGLTLFERLRESHTECCVQGWRNPDVFTTVLEKRRRGREDLLLKTGRELVVKLAMDIESGRIKLPGDELLRVCDRRCSMEI